MRPDGRLLFPNHVNREQMVHRLPLRNTLPLRPHGSGCSTRRRIKNALPNYPAQILMCFLHARGRLHLHQCTNLLVSLPALAAWQLDEEPGPIG